MRKLLQRFARAAPKHDDIELAVRVAALLTKVDAEAYGQHSIELRYLKSLKEFRPKAYETLSSTQKKNLDALGVKIGKLIENDFVLDSSEQVTLEELVKGADKCRKKG